MDTKWLVQPIADVVYAWRLHGYTSQSKDATRATDRLHQHLPTVGSVPTTPGSSAIGSAIGRPAATWKKVGCTDQSGGR
jgi:hypothetical protein